MYLSNLNERSFEPFDCFVGCASVDFTQLFLRTVALVTPARAVTLLFYV